MADSFDEAIRDAAYARRHGTDAKLAWRAAIFGAEGGTDNDDSGTEGHDDDGGDGPAAA